MNSNLIKPVHRPWRFVRDFVREEGAQGGMNWGFFSGTRPMGLIKVGSYMSWWNPMALWHAVVKQHGTLKIMRSPMSYDNHHELRRSLEWIMGAGPIVLWNNRVQILDQNNFPGIAGLQLHYRRARVAIGLNHNSTKSVVMYKRAATGIEMGRFLQNEGCHFGILGDGGGSAQMVHNGRLVGGTEQRRVPNALLWDFPAVDPEQPVIKEYVVRPGDTLGRIALQHGFTVAELAAFNNIRNPNFIRVGQIIRFPR